MNNAFTSLKSLAVLVTRDGHAYYTVGRGIMMPARWRKAMTSTESTDAFGYYWGAAYGFRSATIEVRAGSDADIKAGIARLRAKGFVSEREAKARAEAKADEAVVARPRREKMASMVQAMRDCGLRVTIRRTEDGDARVLTITGAKEARDAFLGGCNERQVAFVRSTFLPVEGREDARCGVVEIAD